MKCSLVCLIAGMLVWLNTASVAQDNTSALIPMPNNITECTDGKTFKVNVKTRITSALPQESFIKEELKNLFVKRMGIEPVESTGSVKHNRIELAVDSTLEGEEHYTLKVDKNGISIKGATPGAVYWGVKTLDQLLLGDVCNTAALQVEHVYIDDNPRYSYRAIMIDPARHFLPVKDVKFFIDQMARFKFNVLQIHLTDDQGWRIEIKSHPKLTEIGANRKPGASSQGPDNGFYTQEEIKEIISYAAQRNIEVVPELDIPGHSVAILAAYPEIGCSFRHSEKKDLGSTTNMMLCASNEKAYAIYKDIIREVAELFPSERLHLGGDEAAVQHNWAKCPDCLAMMEELGFDKPSQLMIPFFEKILGFVSENGKKPILWCELDNIWPPANEYLFPYPEDVTLVTWRNALTPKCIELTRKHGHKLIMAPGEHAYLDYPQYPGDLPEFNNWGMPVTTLEKTYGLDPGYGLPSEEQAHIEGVMATLWAEAIRDINRLTYMTYPRGMAIAEAGWSTMEHRSWDSFKERIYPNIVELMKSGVSVRVPFEIIGR